MKNEEKKKLITPNLTVRIIDTENKRHKKIHFITKMNKREHNGTKRRQRNWERPLV